MKKKSIIRIALALLLAALLGGCLYLNSLMPIITGSRRRSIGRDMA